MNKILICHYFNFKCTNIRRAFTDWCVMFLPKSSAEQIQNYNYLFEILGKFYHIPNAMRGRTIPIANYALNNRPVKKLSQFVVLKSWIGNETNSCVLNKIFYFKTCLKMSRLCERVNYNYNILLIINKSESFIIC